MALKQVLRIAAVNRCEIWCEKGGSDSGAVLIFQNHISVMNDFKGKDLEQPHFKLWETYKVQKCKIYWRKAIKDHSYKLNFY